MTLGFLVLWGGYPLKVARSGALVAPGFGRAATVFVTRARANAAIRRSVAYYRRKPLLQDTSSSYDVVRLERSTE